MQSLSIRRFQYALLLAALALALMLYGYQAVAYVRRAIPGANPPNAAWVWVDALDERLHPVSPPSGSFEDTLRLPDKLWIENTTGADVRLLLDSREVYHGSETVPVSLADMPAGQPVSFRFEYQLPTQTSRDEILGLSQEGLFGFRYPVPPWSYAPPGEDVGGSKLLTGIARSLSILALAAALIVLLASLNLSRRAWLVMGCICALALVVRLLTLSEKFAYDPTLWNMATVWDNFVLFGRRFMSRDFVFWGTDYPQGNLFYMTFLQMILGPNLKSLYLFQTVVGGLTPALFILAGWALFSRRVGYVAGLMAALYAPLIHYQQTVLLDAGASTLVCLLMLTTAALYRWRRWEFAILSGLLVGLLTLFRGSFALMGLWPVAALLLTGIPWQRKSALALLTAACAIGVVLPVIITNFSTGHAWLTPSRSDIQFFRANNQDAMGLNTFQSQSERLASARKLPWLEALPLDNFRQPGRPLELTIRRAALFLEPVEHSVDGQGAYTPTGLAVSPTLRLLSLNEGINFRLVSLLALAALVLAFGTRCWRSALVTASGTATFILSVSFLYVEGRTRIAGAVPTLLLASAAPVLLWRLLPVGPRFVRWAALAAACVMGVILLTGFILNTFPRPKTVAAPPADFVPVSGVYNDEIQLLGYAAYETNFRPQGYLTFELYWQALRKPSKNDVVTFRFYNTRTRQIDRIENTQLAIHSPDLYSADWQPGVIYYDRYLLALPTLPDGTEGAGYSLFVGLYDTDTQTVIPLSDAQAEVQDNHLRLTGTGVYRNAPEVASAPSSAAVWGNAMALTNAACQKSASAVHVRLDWLTLRRPERSWHLFVHLLDKDGNLLTQRDGLPVDDLPIDTWMPGQPQSTEWDFGNQPNAAAIRVGFYDPFIGERWPVSQAGDYSTRDNFIQTTCASQ
jgi:hypothetical protein